MDTLSETEKTYPNDKIIKEDNTEVLNKTTDQLNNIKTAESNNKNSELIKENTKNIQLNKNINKLNYESENSFTELNKSLSTVENHIKLENDFKFNNNTDKLDYIEISKNNFVFDGNGKTIDANNNNFKFYFSNAENITIQNTIFKNGIIFSIRDVKNIIINNVIFENIGKNITDNPINITYSNVNIINTLITNTNSKWGSIITCFSNISIINTTFANSTSKYATAIYGSESETHITNSTFINLFANVTAGALGFKESNNVTIENCKFTNVSSNKNGGAILTDIPGMTGYGKGFVLINNTCFTNCSSGFGGAYLQLGANLTIIDSNFTNNHADFNGGAIYLSNTNSLIENSIFSNNEVNLIDGYPTYGGAIFFDYGFLSLNSSEFINNVAYQGSGVYIYDSEYHIDNLTFTNNTDHVIYTFFDGENSTMGTINGLILNLSDFNNTWYPSLIEGERMEIVLINNTMNSTDIPKYYDLRKLNLTTPVKNQGQMGDCWAFGTTASLESAVLKALNTTIIFSENNMKNALWIYSPYDSVNFMCCEGGKNLMGIAYLLSWFGAFSEDYDTYDELGKISPLILSDKKIHVQDIIIIPHSPQMKHIMIQIVSIMLKKQYSNMVH